MEVGYGRENSCESNNCPLALNRPNFEEEEARDGSSPSNNGVLSGSSEVNSEGRVTDKDVHMGLSMSYNSPSFSEMVKTRTVLHLNSGILQQSPSAHISLLLYFLIS